MLLSYQLRLQTQKGDELECAQRQKEESHSQQSVAAPALYRHQFASKPALDESKLPTLPLSPSNQLQKHPAQKRLLVKPVSTKSKPPAIQPSATTQVRRKTLFGDDDSSPMDIDVLFSLNQPQPVLSSTAPLQELPGQEEAETRSSSRGKKKTKARHPQHAAASTQSKDGTATEQENDDPFAFV